MRTQASRSKVRITRSTADIMADNSGQRPHARPAYELPEWWPLTLLLMALSAAVVALAFWWGITLLLALQP